MGYHQLDPAALSPTEDYPCDRRSLSTAAGLTTLVLAQYALAPGEDLARAYHSHELREEAFYVLDGTLHVETPAEEYRVPEGEALVVEPANPIRPYNPAEAAADVRVLGTGAPKTDPARQYEP
jgi:quercetin dioxygenase-like cupin family protein